MAAPQTTNLYQPFNAIIDTQVLDVSVKEDHVAEIEVTDHAVEQGAPVTDHARPKPLELTIEGVVTNTPLNRFQTLRAENAGGLVWQTTATGNNVRGMPGAAEAAYNFFKDYFAKPRLIPIVTQLRWYDNMVGTSFKVTRDEKTGDVLRFEAKFKQVRVVNNGVTVVATSVPKAKKPTIKTSPTSTSAANPPAGVTIAEQNEAERLNKLRGYKSGT